MSDPTIAKVSVDGVTDNDCSVLATQIQSERRPVILVHGILDNLWRWMTRIDAETSGLELADYRKTFPLFDPTVTLPLHALKVFPGAGLLPTLLKAGIPGVAFSYQHAGEPVAGITNAIDKLHRIVQWAKERWNATHVDLVGHSRGGLVCRHALLHDSELLTAETFRDSVNSLVTICTPHLGSKVADFVKPIEKGMKHLPIARHLLGQGEQTWKLADYFQAMVFNLAQLSPDSEEVKGAASSLMPSLPGGYFAIAGDVPHYVAVEVPFVGTMRMPPSFPIPELTVGQGDTCVSVASALDLPAGPRNRTKVFPVNHLTACMHADVHSAILEWL